jgi:hypothetical protein
VAAVGAVAFGALVYVAGVEEATVTVTGIGTSTGATYATVETVGFSKATEAVELA